VTGIDSLIASLDQARDRLDHSELSDDEQAELIDRIAEIAVELGSELDRRARTTSSQPGGSTDGE
jgi:hypothetical protein